MTALLEVRSLTKHFSGVAAVDGVDMAVALGEIVAIIGPNGSGKTTLFNLVSGFLRPTAGDIRFCGRRTNGIPPHTLVTGGLARTFQQAMSFPSLTVRENIEVPGLVSKRKKGVELGRILDMCNLAEQAAMPAGILPYGKQRVLGVAIALATSPKLLLLDEPATGLDDEASHDLARLIHAIREEGVAVVVIDHDMPFLLPLADRVIVMEAGRVLFEGTAESVMSHERVIEIYLGNDIE
jgi:branched-chain amino acid transport system ATP-binding protein